MFYVILNNIGNSGFFLALHKVNVFDGLSIHRRKAHLPIGFTAPSRAELCKRHFVIPCPSYQADSPAVGGLRHMSSCIVQGQRQYYMDGKRGQYPVLLNIIYRFKLQNVSFIPHFFQDFIPFNLSKQEIIQTKK